MFIFKPTEPTINTGKEEAKLIGKVAGGTRSRGNVAAEPDAEQDTRNKGTDQVLDPPDIKRRRKQPTPARSPRTLQHVSTHRTCPH